jgi:hypothetical protein
LDAVQKQHEVNSWQDYISHHLDLSKELDADFCLPKILLMSPRIDLIRSYGTLQQYSSKIHEQAHKMNLKDGWNASKANLNYLPQVCTFQRGILCFQIRELNLQTLAQRREISTATCNVLPSGTDLAAPLSSQSYAKPEFMELQNSCDGKILKL